jgi:DNA-binding protein H-NS
MPPRSIAIPDLDSLSLEQLAAVVERANELRAQKIDAARDALRMEMSEKAQALGLSMDELMAAESSQPRKGRRARKGPTKPAAIRFRGPKGETWSGRGRPPRWLTALEAKGQKREKFAV